MQNRVERIIGLLEECKEEVLKNEILKNDEFLKKQNIQPKLYRCQTSYTEDGDLSDPLWLIANSYDEAFMRFNVILGIDEDRLYYDLLEYEPDDEGIIDVYYY